MRVLRLGFLICVSALVFFARPAQAENRLAFVVGNDSYDRLPADRQLQNAFNDAQAVASTLEQLQFKVTLKRNLSRSDLIDALSDFSAGIQEGDVVFFFYAGHGVALDGANYLLPTDISSPRNGGGESEEARLKEKAISESRVVEWLKKRGAGASVAVVVLDACRDNPLNAAGGRSLGVARGLEPPLPTQGLMSIYSAGFGESAWDRLNDADQNRNSVFTRVFVEVLKTPGLDLQGVARETRHRVFQLAKSAGKTQMPGYYDQIDGQIFLAGHGSSEPSHSNDAPSEPPAPPPYCARGEEYDRVLRSEGFDAFRAYVQRCRTGGKYLDEAMHEFENRLFAAGADCIRRASGCSFEGCVDIYARELPTGARAQALRAQADAATAAKAACRPAREPPEPPHPHPLPAPTPAPSPSATLADEMGAWSRWAIANQANCYDPKRAYALERKGGFLIWRSGEGNIDVEAISFSNEGEIETTTQRSDHGRGKGERVGQSWLYEKIRADRVKVTPGGRAPFVLTRCP
jgi:hypothetical protein